MSVQELSGVLLPGPAEALAGLLDIAVPDLSNGLPLLWHSIYLLPRTPQASLGPDGHPLSGVLPTPPGPGLRRMFAGGRVKTTGQLRVGEPATRRSQVVRSVAKTGRSGPLTFVTVVHEILQGGVVIVSEEQDIVYRPPQQPEAAGTASPERAPVSVGGASNDVAGRGKEEHSRTVVPTPALLFRYSALTYNAHRIHYDRDWAAHEGHAGLVVHGPFQALLMAEHFRSLASPTGEQRFSYRLLAPLCAPDPFQVTVHREDGAWRTAVTDVRGVRTATGTLRSPADT